MKNKKIAISVLILLISISALCVAATSFAWIRRDWSPKFYSNELTVQTSGSLAIMLDGTSATYSEVDLNNVLNLGAFKLQQVSSQTGLSDDFFKINYDNGHGHEKLVHITALTGESHTSMALRNGYIEAQFLIVCKAEVDNQTEYDKYVFFDSRPDKSYIELVGENTGADASNAIRISISVKDTSINYIFKKGVKTHTGAKGPVDGVYIADGKEIYLLNSAGGIEATDQSLVGTNVAYNFDDFNGGQTGDQVDPATLDTSKVLFSMANIDQRWVTVRIWLEGYDPNCTDAIAGSKIKLKLTFRSIDKVHEE